MKRAVQCWENSGKVGKKPILKDYGTVELPVPKPRIQDLEESEEDSNIEESEAEIDG